MKTVQILFIISGLIIISGCLSSGQSDIIQSSSGNTTESDPVAMANISANIAAWNAAGVEVDPIAMANITANFAQWSLDTGGAVNASTCNPANQASSYNGTGFECVSIASSDDQTLAQVLTEGNTANMNIDMAGYNVTNSGNLQLNISTGTSGYFYRSDKTWAQIAIDNVLNLQSSLDAKGSSVNDTQLFENITRLDGVNTVQNSSITALQTSDAGKVNKTGSDNLNTTGNITALILNLSYASTDTTANSPLSIMNLVSNSIIRPAFQVSHNTATYRTIMDFKKSRGTKEDPTVVAAGNMMGDFYFDAYNGTGFVESANFGARITDINSTTGIVRSVLYFSVKNTSIANPAPRFLIADSGIGIGANSTDFFWNILPTERLHIKSGTIKIDDLSGSGNAITQIDSTGKLFTNRTAGAGITLQSPDGTYSCVTVTDAHAIAVSTAACP